MGIDAWITLAVVVTILILLIWNLAPADWLFLGGTALLAAIGIIDTGEALAGFSNSAMITVAALFVVAAGLRDTGFLDYLGHRVLGAVRTAKAAKLRLATCIVPLSAFLNNT